MALDASLSLRGSPLSSASLTELDESIACVEECGGRRPVRPPTREAAIERNRSARPSDGSGSDPRYDRRRSGPPDRLRWSESASRRSTGSACATLSLLEKRIRFGSRPFFRHSACLTEPVPRKPSQLTIYHKVAVAVPVDVLSSRIDAVASSRCIEGHVLWILASVAMPVDVGVGCDAMRQARFRHPRPCRTP